MFRSVLAGFDGSRHDLDAVGRAAEIAETERATLTLITVYSSGVPWPLTGANGSGKSSVLSLVAGLYPPTRGTVLVDGIPTRDLSGHWLREQIAVVPQETVLFSGSILENIHLGQPGASTEEVVAAAANALVTEFADDFPGGLEHRLGDRGTGLSGGQRQRISIARALLRDAPIVLLDEPTSELDSEAEQGELHALCRLMRGRTVLMVTHRPALLDLAKCVAAGWRRHLRRSRPASASPASRRADDERLDTFGPEMAATLSVASAPQSNPARTAFSIPAHPSQR